MSPARSRLRSSPAAISWRVWPLADGEGRAWLWLVLVGVFAFVAAEIMQEPIWGGVVLVLFLVSLRRLFVPVTYQLSSDGIERKMWRGWRRISWRKVRRYHVFPDGIFFAFTQEPEAFDSFRGVYVPLGRRVTLAIRKDALAIIRHYVNRHSTVA